MRPETANILSFLDAQLTPGTDAVAKSIADDFRARRIEKNMTRRMVANASGVAISNIARFEQKGLISLHNLIDLAIALGYLGELRTVFAEPKFSTMSELTLIKENRGKKKAYPRKKLL